MATRPFRRQLVRILNIGEYTWMLIDYDYLGSPLFKLMLCFFFFLVQDIFKDFSIDH